MISKSGRFTIVYNGEVYNFRILRGELEAAGIEFRSGSDTEVVLEAIEEWGFENALKRFVGMFAFALYDDHEKSLTLVRDRLGIKPLYVGFQRGVMIFGSELKPLKEVPDFEFAVNKSSLAEYLDYGYVPCPHSIFTDIWKVPPGHFTTVDCRTIQDEEEPEFVPYWSVSEVVKHGKGNQFQGNPKEAVDALDYHLRESVKCRLVSDVPVGAFLSGGIDSSAVVAIMKEESSSNVKTFSIGFDDEGYDEAVFAKKVANHLGTDHVECYVSPSDAQSVVPDLPEFYDEPFSDSSQIPTYLVSRLARKHVTVSLSGDGGDELFAGYNRYGLGYSAWKAASRVPRPIKRAASSLIGGLTRSQWDWLYSKMEWTVPLKFRVRLPGYRIKTLSKMLETEDAQEFYSSLISHGGSGMVRDLERARSRDLNTMSSDPPIAIGESFIERMMFWDTIGYMPEDILTKVDRASMAVSLEARVPLIDHRLVEFSWTLPLNYKLREGKGKWVLRELLARYVPRELFERPKMGFGIPLSKWLREELRDWAEDLLNEDRIREEGIFDVVEVRKLWKEHLSGEMDWEFRLWDILMFQAWYQNWR